MISTLKHDIEAYFTMYVSQHLHLPLPGVPHPLAAPGDEGGGQQVVRHAAIVTPHTAHQGAGLHTWQGEEQGVRLKLPLFRELCA